MSKLPSKVLEYVGFLLLVLVMECALSWSQVGFIFATATFVYAAFELLWLGIARGFARLTRET